MKDLIHMLSMQIFAEGGAAAGAGDGAGGTADGSGANPVAAAQEKAVSRNPLANVKYGIQENSAPPAAEGTEGTQDLASEFEEAIKGKYKDQYNAKVKATVEARLKGSRQNAERLKAVTPLMESLAQRYGKDPSDIKGIQKAMDADDKYLDDEAYERNMPKEELKRMKQLERQAAEAERMRQQDYTNHVVDGWRSQEQELQAIYPGMSLDTEMENPGFAKLLEAGIDVRTAYEVAHKDEIMQAGMQFAVQKTAEKTSAAVAANMARPVENGMSGQSAAIVKSDVSKLSKLDRAEINRRVARGERISF